MEWCTRGMAVLVAALVVGPALADDGAGKSNVELAQEDRIAELERTVKILAEELERTRVEIGVPEEPELKSMYGLGPAASKVYQLTRGLSIGGYGEGFYKNFVKDQGSGPDKQLDRADMLRVVLYTGYKFREDLVFNAEFEFEHAITDSTVTSGGGSASVEFATLDYLWKDWANLRGGLVLVPMGFLNEIHEPPYYLGVDRPDVERFIIPTTWRENGAGLFGRFAEWFEYKAYVVNGLNAVGFDASGLRGGRQKGNRALAEDLAFVGRFDWVPTYSFLLGASVYLGNSGQGQDLLASDDTTIVGVPDTFTTIWDVHAEYRAYGFHLRALFAMAHLGEAGDLTRALRVLGDIGASEAVASDMLGGYVEVAYDVLPWLYPDTDRSLEPYFRYEYYDTQFNMPSGFSADETKTIQNLTFGMQLKPIPNIVVKVDYRNRKAQQGVKADEFNIGVGYAF